MTKAEAIEAHKRQLKVRVKTRHDWDSFIYIDSLCSKWIDGEWVVTLTLRDGIGRAISSGHSLESVVLREE